MASEIVIHRSPGHHAHGEESLVRKMFGMIGQDHMPHRTRSEALAHHGAHVIRQGGESMLTGLALGAIHAKKGLDYQGKYPLDLGLAAAGYLAALGISHDETATDARN